MKDLILHSMLYAVILHIPETAGDWRIILVIKGKEDYNLWVLLRLRKCYSRSPFQIMSGTHKCVVLSPSKFLKILKKLSFSQRQRKLFITIHGLKSPALRVCTQPFVQAKIKENMKAPRQWPLRVEFRDSDEFLAQMASNAGNVSIWWRHHAMEPVAGWFETISQW